MAKWLTLFIKMNLEFTKMIYYVLRRMIQDGEAKAHFRWDPRFKFLKTDLDSFEANWILELDLALDPSLHIRSLNHVHWILFGFNQLVFPSKWFLVILASICHFLVLDPHLWFSTNMIILFYIWTLDLRLSFKVALSYFEGIKMKFSLNCFLKMKDYIHESWSQYYKRISINLFEGLHQNILELCTKLRKFVIMVFMGQVQK